VAGGDDDEVFFGSIGTVRADGAGETLLLDTQLAQVHRFGSDGTLLGTIGKEGDGPGEVRRPNDMFVRDDGTICLLQGFPGRVVRLHPDGTPAGDATYSQGEASQGQFAVMVRGLDDPEGMVLAGIRMNFSGGGASTQHYFLARCDAEGRQRQALLEKEHVIDYSAFELDEASMDFVWSRIATAPQGRLVVAPQRDAMHFVVYGPDGTAERAFDRVYASGQRTEAERLQAHKIIEAVGANYPTPPRRITVEDREPAVTGMWTTSDGRLWVQPGHLAGDLPAGTWTRLDVYGPDGIFERQVALQGGHNPLNDALFILPDGRCVVVVGALDAWLTQQAVATVADGNTEASPLEVICYLLEM
jgi:hypothetical protein